MLSLVLRSAPNKPATVLYPRERPFVPEHFRGSIAYVASRCIGCKICERDCPSRDAITITKVGDKRFDCRISRDRCIACGQCVDSCPRDALEMVTTFELAALRRDELRIVFPAEPAPAAAPEAAAGGGPPAGDGTAERTA